MSEKLPESGHTEKSGHTGKIYFYTIFERLWHWFQAAMIIFLVISGFEIHGSISLSGFETAAHWHNYTGIGWLVLLVFIFFWMAVTGEWRQYIPTTKKIFQVMRYYLYGIFRHEPHPVPKSIRHKHNPLQRMTYVMTALGLFTMQLVTGFLYYSYNSWPASFIKTVPLEIVAGIHTAGAFFMLMFLVIHVYMITTGHSVSAHFKAMITGWEDVDTDAVNEDIKQL